MQRDHHMVLGEGQGWWWCWTPGWLLKHQGRNRTTSSLGVGFLALTLISYLDEAVIPCFFKTLVFKSSFRFTEKLKGNTVISHVPHTVHYLFNPHTNPMRQI